MKAWIVTNEYLNTSKFNEITQWLLIAAGRYGIAAEVKTNAELMTVISSDLSLKDRIELPDFVLFMDKDIRLARYLEINKIPVFNSADSIAACDDKGLTHILLSNAGIPMPKTIIAPFTYDNIGYKNLDFVEKVEIELSYPIVIKESFGSFGMQVYKAENHDELISILEKTASKPVIFQQFLSMYAGSDLRLQVVGKEVIATMLRYSVNGDFRANISNGGKMERYNPSEDQKKIALKAVEVLGLDFAGVDLLFSDKEEPILCEVNSNAHFKSIFECTGVNAADYIIRHIINKLKK